MRPPDPNRSQGNLTQERLREIVSYDADTGDFRWKRNRGGKAVAGSIAGETRKNGYKVIMIDLKKYYSHRLAWLYSTGKWPPHQIDHIDGNPSNNRLNNLRPATASENVRYARIRVDNRSGLKGVSWSRRDRVWKSFIRLNGKTMGLGSFTTKEEAYAAYCVAAQENYGQFWRPE